MGRDIWKWAWIFDRRPVVKVDTCGDWNANVCFECGKEEPSPFLEWTAYGQHCEVLKALDKEPTDRLMDELRRALECGEPAFACLKVSSEEGEKRWYREINRGICETDGHQQGMLVALVQVYLKHAIEFVSKMAFRSPLTSQAAAAHEEVVCHYRRKRGESCLPGWAEVEDEFIRHIEAANIIHVPEGSLVQFTLSASVCSKSEMPPSPGEE